MIFQKILSMIRTPFHKYKYKKDWRMKNPHNHTVAGTNLGNGVEVGNYSYGIINVPYKQGALKIGHYCSISDNVNFFTAGEHYKNHLSTYPFYAHILNKGEPGGTSKGDIIIEDDVWIGWGACVLSGVRVGQGAIIGAQSVVAKDVPPYAIWGGNGVIKYRFSDEKIKKMLLFDFSKLTEEDIKNNIDLLYSEINDDFFETQFYKDHLKSLAPES